MLCYVLRHFLLLTLMVLAVSVIIFLMLRLGIGDPTLNYLRLSNLPPTPEMLASTRTMLGLDQLLYVQYGTWLWKALHPDFGILLASQRPVLDNMLSLLPATLKLVDAALALILLTSVPFGIWAARHHDRLLDSIVRFITFLDVPMPNFRLAFLLAMTFSVYLQRPPTMGYGGWQYTILFAVPIAFMLLVVNAHLLYASMLDAAGQRHITWACLHDLNDRQTEHRHILCNASLPIITAVRVHIDELIGRTMIIENTFAWPGVGRYAASAIFNRDYPVIQYFMLMTAVAFVVYNLIADLLNATLDPRIRHHGGAYA